MSASLKNLNEFVTIFLESNGIDSDTWTCKENQDELKKVVSKAFAAKSTGKSSKDPAAPKHPKSAYIFFCQDYRSKAKEELGEDAKTTEITSHLGSLWSALKDDKKKVKELNKYMKMAEDDKLRFTEEMEDYTPSDGFKKKVPKGKKEPSKPLSSFMLFCKDYRPIAKEELGDEGKSLPQVGKRLGEMWKELKEDESRLEEYEKYVAMAVDAKAEFLEKNPVASKPKASAAKPKASAAKPKAWVAKPKPSTAKPKSGGKPKPSTAKPKAGGKPKAPPATKPKSGGKTKQVKNDPESDEETPIDEDLDEETPIDDDDE